MTCALSWAGLVAAKTPEAPAQPAAAAAPPAAAPAPAAAAITDADLKSVAVPKPEEKAAGDPAGTLTGTAADIPVGDPKKGLTVGDLVSAVGQNLIATNFV